MITLQNFVKNANEYTLLLTMGEHDTAGTSAKTVSPSTGKLGIKSVIIEPTPSSPKTVTPTKSVQNVTPNEGEHLSDVTVNAIPDEYIIPTGTQTITTNGTVDVTNLASVVVNVPTIAG